MHDHCHKVCISATLVLLSAILAGCELAGESGIVPPGEPVAREAAENMFKASYSAIGERFIEPLDVETVATSGFRGLSDLDPVLAVGRIGDVVYLSALGKPVAAEPVPKPRDVAGWAKLTVRLWQRARVISPAVREAGEEGLYRAVLPRALTAIDPYGRYADPAEARANRRNRDGYLGIGAGFRIEDGQATVTEVVGEGPAERAGLRVGDIVLRIDSQPVDDATVETLVDQLEETTSGWVTMTVRRPGHSGAMQLSMRRDYLIPDTVIERYEDGILDLVISRFNQKTAERIEEAVRLFASASAGRLHGVILDLRGNPGGLLRQAVKIADLFLETGPILETRGRNPESVRSYAAGGGDVLHALPLVILVDGRSASAAELLAAALQERRRAVVVGSASYGKDGVQTVVPLPNGGEISFTWSVAVPPSGETLHGRGIAPLVCTSGLYFADAEAIDSVLKAGHPSGRTSASASGGCPAEPRDGRVDPDVAHRLIKDRRLFAELLQRDQLFAASPVHTLP